MNLPAENPAPACIQDLAAFFDQQQQAVEEALCQNYALHESHLVFLEHALAHTQADQPHKAEVDLLRFYAAKQQRLIEQAKLQAAIGRREPSPHRERHKALLDQLSEALRTKNAGQ